MEEQQSQAAESSSHPRPHLTPDQLAKHKVCEGLLLTRSRILQQFGAAQNPKHRSMLENALSDIEAKIAHLG